jgi:predicted nucleic acid-binding protein
MHPNVDQWRAFAVGEVTESDTVLFDTNLVRQLYEAHRRGDRHHQWKLRVEPVPITRRVVNEVVLWELKRHFQGADWDAWRRRYLQRVSLDRHALRAFTRLLDHVFRPGTQLGGAADALLAAHCLLPANSWVLATDNVKDFCQIPGLRLLVPPRLDSTS